MKKVLLIAFHFPPAAMGSGHLRTLGFARHLPAHGWQPFVLTANRIAYPRISARSEQLIPTGCQVTRAPALDVSRHLALHGKYFGFMAQPDRWAPWWLGAVMCGMRLIRHHHIDALWSTYPIMTAHHIAWTLSGRCKLPWIADFRDPVRSSVEADNPLSVASQHRWEPRVVRRASAVTVTTDSARDAYCERYPGPGNDGRIAVIANGYEETDFREITASDHQPVGRGGPLELVHAGALYRDGRNPLAFFRALAGLLSSGELARDAVRVTLRASGADVAYQDAINKLDLSDVVRLAPAISHAEALQEQSRADGLLLFQGEKFDRQIPAKAYEYFRLGRPILALVGMHGDTARLLRRTNAAHLAPIDQVSDITHALQSFLRDIRQGCARTMDRSAAASYSRQQGAAALAALLDTASAASRSGTRMNAACGNR